MLMQTHNLSLTSQPPAMNHITACIYDYKQQDEYFISLNSVENLQ